MSRAIVSFALFQFHSGTATALHGRRLLRTRTGPYSIGAALLTTVFILGASLLRPQSCPPAAARVARQVGGTLVPADVQDPLRRRLRNVVEEMAIASGVPVPEIYVLEEEGGINAFAAGFTPSDAAIAVTRGALELLERDELQGVIAHEFSHILNGDMRLNIRLMGVLFGIMVLGLIGRLIIRGGYHTSILTSRRDRGAPVVLIIGLGLAILGGIGMFFARIIKAGVSRQREYLADASAVQFTRQSDGIANALKKIGGYSQGSLIREADPEEVSHMLFGAGSKLFGMFATHPPLVDRIQALDPNFKEVGFPAGQLARAPAASSACATEATAGFAGDVTTAFASGGTGFSSTRLPDLSGRPENEHVEYAQQLRRVDSRRSLYDAAHSPEFAYLLTIALVLDRSGQGHRTAIRAGARTTWRRSRALVRRYYDELAAYRRGVSSAIAGNRLSRAQTSADPGTELSCLAGDTHDRSRR